MPVKEDSHKIIFFLPLFPSFLLPIGSRWNEELLQWMEHLCVIPTSPLRYVYGSLTQFPFYSRTIGRNNLHWASMCNFHSGLDRAHIVLQPKFFIRIPVNIFPTGDNALEHNTFLNIKCDISCGIQHWTSPIQDNHILNRRNNLCSLCVHELNTAA